MKIFSTVIILKQLKDEHGIILLEFVIALPLIVILLWSMSNLFVSSWQKCKCLIADFVLQQEMQSAMVRVIDAAKVAYKFKVDDGKYVFYYYHFNQDVTDAAKFSNGSESDNCHEQYKYFNKEGKIYRGVSSSALSGEPNQITGDSLMFNTFVDKFEITQKDKLLKIKLQARSLASGNKILFITEVYMKGLK